MTEERKTVKIGDAVTFIDSLRIERPALVTAVFSQSCINLVYVSDDQNQHDSYGRQIARNTSVAHKSLYQDQVFGNVWY
jgi:hypothetical protein